MTMPIRLASRTLAACAAFLCASAASAEDWRWDLTPYLWVIGTELETAVAIPPGDNPLGASTAFSDLLGKLDFAAQVHAEGHRDGYGFLVDYTVLNLSDTTGQDILRVETDSSTTLLEGAALMDVPGSTSKAELLLGFRRLNIELDLEIEGLGPVGIQRKSSTDAKLVDVMLGARYHHDFSDKWHLTLRGDVATGDTDFSWNVAANFGRSIGKSGTLVLGYRYLNVKLEDEDEFLKPELTISGPQIGYTFTF